MADEDANTSSSKGSAAQGKRSLAGKKLAIKKKLWSAYSSHEKQFLDFWISVENFGPEESLCFYVA